MENYDWGFMKIWGYILFGYQGLLFPVNFLNFDFSKSICTSNLLTFIMDGGVFCLCLFFDLSCHGEKKLFLDPFSFFI